MHHVAEKLMQEQDDDRDKAPVSYFYQPTDPDLSSLASQRAYIEDLQRQNKNANVVVASPLQLTLDESGIRQVETAVRTTSDQWDVIMCISMIHISLWSATLGLMQLAGASLRPGSGILYLYGPYRVNGTCAESNRYV
jgi:hypothetical protein